MMTMTELKSQRSYRKISMADVRFYNAQNGQYYFSRDTMRFFASRIESALLGGDYFITSEKAGFDSVKRVFSARLVNDDFSITTLEPCHLSSRAAAMDVIKAHRESVKAACIAAANVGGAR